MELWLILILIEQSKPMWANLWFSEGVIYRSIDQEHNCIDLITKQSSSLVCCFLLSLSPPIICPIHTSTVCFNVIFMLSFMTDINTVKFAFSWPFANWFKHSLVAFADNVIFICTHYSIDATDDFTETVVMRSGSNCTASVFVNWFVANLAVSDVNQSTQNTPNVFKCVLFHLL